MWAAQYFWTAVTKGQRHCTDYSLIFNTGQQYTRKNTLNPTTELHFSMSSERFITQTTKSSDVGVWFFISVVVYFRLECDSSFSQCFLLSCWQHSLGTNLSLCCRRLVVRATAMLSQAFHLSPWPGLSQPSWFQHSSNTAFHFSSGGTARIPSFRLTKQTVRLLKWNSQETKHAARKTTYISCWSCATLVKASIFNSLYCELSLSLNLKPTI